MPNAWLPRAQKIYRHFTQSPALPTAAERRSELAPSHSITSTVVGEASLEFPPEGLLMQTASPCGTFSQFQSGPKPQLAEIWKSSSKQKYHYRDSDA